MNDTSRPCSASITADFVLASGPEARAWLRAISGFQMLADEPDAPVLAVRGAVASQRVADGRHWLALADLIQGDLADGASHADSAQVLQRNWRGRFAQVVWNPRSGAMTAFTDHFGTLPLYWYRDGAHFAIASDLRLLLGAPGCQREPDLQAIYHYLNFAVVPAPLTICRQIRKLEPGTRMQWQHGALRCERYYLPDYPEDLRGNSEQLRSQLREHIIASVHAYRPAGKRDWGCFLSGGTDSSSIVSILRQQDPDAPVSTCSIGFAEAGYDEMAYARLAADACGATPHFDAVDRTRALQLLDTVLDAYDQPFGNASAIPTLACAQLGKRLGMRCMLAGDGGDEIFGGNQRYAKDKVMAAFYRLPGPLKSLARGITAKIAGGHVHLLNRIHSFTKRASLPNPDRFYSDDAFASDFYDTLLTDAFRAQVPRDASLALMRERFEQGEDAAPLHRIMRLDLAMAIAQNDLVKVNGACKYHDVGVRFPYLDRDLVDYTGRLPAQHKVRRLNKRDLFKRAMAGILPVAILKKPKQGFGLPVAVWLKDDAAMQAHVRSVLLDERTRARGWIRPEFVAELLDRHMAGGWDYSAQIWQLLVLELWLRRYMDVR
ncbi:MAG: hypothetical protein COZ47_03225 [Lysobacterales bacterium CG_4_10_14_3_um_filter_64_11]|nr:MAG: hypothetical protein COZ47_03225 [Xanthomonadales bacterium CG_4_10_14_3_um_filter_64_11]